MDHVAAQMGRELGRAHRASAVAQDKGQQNDQSDGAAEGQDFKRPHVKGKLARGDGHA